MTFTSSDKPITYKTVFMGDSGVGKSSLATRIACDTFSTYTDATIGASFFAKIIEHDNKRYKFNIWDTAGQEKYSCLVPLYYRNSDAALIVYDITNRETYKKAISSIDELRKNSSVSAIIIIGNKSDLESQRRVTNKEAKEFCQTNDVIFLETSAKNNINIREILTSLVEKLPAPNVNCNGLPVVEVPRDSSYFDCCY